MLFKRSFNYNLLIMLFFFSSLGFSQSKESAVNGFVYDARTGEALIGANVYIKEFNIGAATNLSGFFAIPNVPAGKRDLTISFMGYKTKVLNINIKVLGNEVLKIFLNEESVQTKEIIVQGDSVRTIDKLYSKPVSKIELNANQINTIPRVIEADLLRALQTLPGIQPLNDFSSSLYIRGGTPDQNLYMIDGTDVYNPEHAFGLFSTFNTNAIKKVELSKGGFGAEYGGRLSSVLNVTNIDGNRYDFKADINISLISASATLQSPLGNIGSISGSFRRTYIDQTYAKFIKEIPDYYFYDGNLKAFLDLDDKDKLTFSFYGGQDKLNYIFDKTKPDPVSFKYDWGNQTASLNWKRIFNPELFANFWVTASLFNSNFYFDELNIVEKNRIYDYTIKGSLEYYLSKSLNLKFGFENKILEGSLLDEFSGGKVDADKHRNHYIGYITTGYKPFDGLDIETGLRYDFFRTEKNYQDLDPRFTIKYRLSELSSIKFSAGNYHQYLNRIPRMFITSIWTSADKNEKGSSAQHYILGYQREIDQIYEFEIEAYYKKYQNVYSYNQNYMVDIQPNAYDEKGQPIFTDSKSLFSRGDGDSYGIEVMLRKDYGAITGWLGYSFSRSNSMIDGLNQGKEFVPRQDRTHTINSVTNININELIDEINDVTNKHTSKWLFSMNFIYASGQPITLPNSIYWINTLPDWTNNQNNIAIYPAAINSARLPAYIRMDISITWEKNYTNWTLAPYIQIFNVGNRKNVWFVNYDNTIKDGQVEQKIKNTHMLPILPSIGVNIRF